MLCRLSSLTVLKRPVLRDGASWPYVEHGHQVAAPPSGGTRISKDFMVYGALLWLVHGYRKCLYFIFYAMSCNDIHLRHSSNKDLNSLCLHYFF